MAFDSADALAKTYARNKKLLSLRSITNGLQQTGLLVAYTYRASVHLDPPLTPLALGGHEPCAAHVCFWHKADMLLELGDVCFWG